jgi:AbrB family looped-hinge helix DNA binding protein
MGITSIISNTYQYSITEMKFHTNVTQKGQVTLSKAIMDKLGIKTRDRVVIEVKDDHITVKPSLDFLTLAGSLNSVAIKDKSPEEILLLEKKAVKDAYRDSLS